MRATPRAARYDRLQEAITLGRWTRHSAPRMHAPFNLPLTNKGVIA